MCKQSTVLRLYGKFFEVQVYVLETSYPRSAYFITLVTVISVLKKIK